MKTTTLKVLIFSIAFGFVEAAVVVYLRHLLDGFSPDVSKKEILLLVPGIAFLQPQTAIQIIRDTAILDVERIREASTLVMLGIVAILSGRKLNEKILFFFFAFGVWDIFYYIFLRLTIGWPATFGDMDIFFLLPTPWVGPVFVPVVISLVLVICSLWYLSRRKK